MVATAAEIAIAPGEVSEIRQHAGPMLAEHWRELCTNPDLLQLKPDWKRYHDLEDRGALFTVCAWDTSTNVELVGYSLNIVGPHLHYSDVTVASNDVLYVRPELRGTTVGARLLKATESLARDLYGAQMMTWHAKPDTTLERILPRRGYRVQDVLFSKELT